MSRKRNNQDPGLNDLLKKKTQTPADDFEREAREGFALLDNEQEAFDLKAKLDERMEQELSELKTTGWRRSYWLVAAGFILVVGLSAYFIMLHPVAKNEEKELAVSPSQSAPGTGSDKRPQQLPEQNLGGAENTPPSSEAKEKEVKRPSAPNHTYASEVSSGVAQAPATGAGQAQQENAPVQEPSKMKADAEADQMTIAAAAPAENRETFAREEAASAPAGSAFKAYAADKAEDFGDCFYEGGDARLQKDLAEQLIAVNLDRHFEARLIINAEGKVIWVDFIKSKYSPEEVVKVTEAIRSLTKFKLTRKGNANDNYEYKVVH